MEYIKLRLHLKNWLSSLPYGPILCSSWLHFNYQALSVFVCFCLHQNFRKWRSRRLCGVKRRVQYVTRPQPQQQRECISACGCKQVQCQAILSSLQSS